MDLNCRGVGGASLVGKYYRVIMTWMDFILHVFVSESKVDMQSRHMRWMNHGKTCIYAFATMLATSATVNADTETGFVIREARAELENNVYYLHADVDYRFSDAVLEAIHNGVPMVVILDVELYSTRRFMWDELVASLEQRYELQYHALSEQYLVSNLNSGEEYTSLTLHSALYGLRDVNKLPVIDQHLLEKGQTYYVRIRARLALNNLPVPLRLNAFISRAWWLGSDWYRWPLNVIAK